MTVTFFALDGTRWESSRVLAAMADWQSGSPAARFSAVLPGADWPEELVTVRWQDDRGFTLFEGYLDTADRVLDADGPRLELTARSAGRWRATARERPNCPGWKPGCSSATGRSLTRAGSGW